MTEFLGELTGRCLFTEEVVGQNNLLIKESKVMFYTNSRHNVLSHVQLKSNLLPSSGNICTSAEIIN